MLTHALRQPPVWLIFDVRQKNAMNPLALTEIYDRGLRDFNSLSEDERRLFVIHDLDIYFEMEGGFEDYFLSGGHPVEIATLISTLRAIGDEESLRVILRIADMNDQDREEMGALCQIYYDRRNERWSRLEASFAIRGIKINETE